MILHTRTGWCLFPACAVLLAQWLVEFHVARFLDIGFCLRALRLTSAGTGTPEGLARRKGGSIALIAHISSRRHEPIFSVQTAHCDAALRCTAEAFIDDLHFGMPWADRILAARRTELAICSYFGLIFRGRSDPTPQTLVHRLKAGSALSWSSSCAGFADYAVVASRTWLRRSGASFGNRLHLFSCYIGWARFSKGGILCAGFHSDTHA